MLNTTDVTATIAVKDLEIARDFYGTKLGLKETEFKEGFYVAYQSGKTGLLVYKSDKAGGYKATVATWMIADNIEGLVKDLAARGVPFHHYPDMLPDTKIEGDLHIIGTMKNAWMYDPDGNILCLASGNM